MPNRNQTFDSNGPEVRIRGNAYQVHEKYLAMARDAFASGDRIMSENYLQHAEHYYRIISAMNEAYAQAQQHYDGGRDGYRGDNGQRQPHGRDYDPRDVPGRDFDFGEDPRGFDETSGMDSDEDGDSLPVRLGPSEQPGNGADSERATEPQEAPEPSRSMRQRRRSPRPRAGMAGGGVDAAADPSGD